MFTEHTVLFGIVITLVISLGFTFGKGFCYMVCTLAPCGILWQIFDQCPGEKSSGRAPPSFQRVERDLLSKPTD
jgi:hypothetical protein